MRIRFSLPFFRKHTPSAVIQDLPRKVPSSFTLEITSRCNFACSFCYCLWHEFPELAGKEDLPLSRWKEILAELIRFRVKSLLFTGGEVLCYPHIRELLVFTRQILPDGRITLFTNGALMTGEFLEKIFSLDIDLAVSLQSLGSCREMTGSDHDAQQTLRLLKQCKNHGRPATVSIVVTQLNRNEICDLFRTAADAGAAFIQLGPMMIQGRGRKRLDLALSRQEWEEIKEKIRNMEDCKTPFTFCEEIFCQCRKFPEELTQKFALKTIKRCTAGRDSGVISPKGIYRKCLHYPGKDSTSLNP